MSHQYLTMQLCPIHRRVHSVPLTFRGCRLASHYRNRTRIRFCSLQLIDVTQACACVLHREHGALHAHLCVPRHVDRLSKRREVCCVWGFHLGWRHRHVPLRRSVMGGFVCGCLLNPEHVARVSKSCLWILGSVCLSLCCRYAHCLACCSCPPQKGLDICTATALS